MSSFQIIALISILVLGTVGGIILYLVNERADSRHRRVDRSPDFPSPEDDLTQNNLQRPLPPLPTSSQPSPIAAPTPESFAKQAATYSLLAPLFGVGLMILFESSARGHRWAMLILSLASGLSILVGLAFGILALVAVQQHERRGIFGKALAGTILCGLLTIFMLAGFLRSDQKAGLAKENERQQVEREGKASFLDYPGWYGTAQDGETVLVVSSLADESPAAKMMNSDLGMDVSIAQVSVINRSASDSVAIDSAKAELLLKDGTVSQCLPLAQVLSSAKEDKDKMLAKFLGPHQVGPQSQLHTVCIYTPFGFNWREVASVTIHLDGRPVTIGGKLLSVAEKAELIAGASRQAGQPPER